MSLRAGNNDKKAQKYKNTKSYQIQFNQSYVDTIAKAPFDRLCQRCREQVQWKIDYGKYKPPTNVSKCIKCQQKSIVKAYRTVCDKCADKEKICSKCHEVKEIIVDPVVPKLDKHGVDREKLRDMEDYLETLRERTRRVVMRELLAGSVKFENGLFVYVETRKPVENLKFKVNYDDKDELWESGDDSDEDFDDDEDDDNIKEKKSKSQKKEKKAVVKDNKEETKEEKRELPQAQGATEDKIKGTEDKNAKMPEPTKAKKKPSDSDSDFDDDDDFDDVSSDEDEKSKKNKNKENKGKKGSGK